MSVYVCIQPCIAITLSDAEAQNIVKIMLDFLMELIIWPICLSSDLIYIRSLLISLFSNKINNILSIP